MQTSFSKVHIAGVVLAALAFIMAMGPVSAGKYKPEEVQAMWKKVDLNADGAITKDEVITTEPALVAAFDKADGNKDGKLNLKEFEVLLSSS